MKIIALRGANNCGKTTALNRALEDLISKGATLISKIKVGADPKDFDGTLNYNGKKIAFFTQGDYAKLTIEAIVRYDRLGFDVLVCASNVKFVTPIKLINSYASHYLIKKSVMLIRANYSIENLKDARIIVGLT